MVQIVMKQTSALKPDPNNPRKSYDKDDIDRLGDDMLARGVLVPLLARPDGTLLDGWRRWLAAQQKAIKELPVIISDQPEAEIAGIRLATTFHKSDLTPYEKCLAVCDLAKERPEMQQKDLAAYLHITPAAVCRYLSLARVTPEWQESFKAGTVGPSDVYAASKVPLADQPGMLAFRLSPGATRNDLEKAGKKARTKPSAEAAVKVTTLRCYLPGGICVTVSGKWVSLEEALEALSKAVAAMKKAIQDGYTAKTLAAAMKDKAKKEKATKS